MIDADTDSEAPQTRFNIAEMAVVAVLVALGLYATIAGFRFGVGTFARMGPGFFPAILGIGLMALGVTLFFEQRNAPATALAMPWRPLFFIFAGLCFWAGAVKPFGLGPATFGLIVIASFAERPFRPVATLAMAFVISAVGILLFIYGFRMPMTAFNW